MKDIITLIEGSWFSNTPCRLQEMRKLTSLYPLPEDYKEFMKWSNGGEGYIGSNYLSLWKVEDILTLNREYQIQTYLLDKSLAIGTDGGDNCIGFYFGEQTKVFIQPLGDFYVKENRFVAQSFSELLNDWLRI